MFGAVREGLSPDFVGDGEVDVDHRLRQGSGATAFARVQTVEPILQSVAASRAVALLKRAKAGGATATEYISYVIYNKIYKLC
jgi:hypothetical protein